MPARIDPHEFYGRYREVQKYLGWTDADAARVRGVADIVAPHLPAVVDDFYEEIERHPNARRVITGGEQQVAQLKGTLLRWLDELFAGPYDAAYVHRRWKVGHRHVDIGLEQIYTTVALARLRRNLCRAVATGWAGDEDSLLATIESLNMILDMDLAIIQDAYEDEYQARLARSRTER